MAALTLGQALYQAARAMLEKCDPKNANHVHLSKVWSVERVNLYKYRAGSHSPSWSTMSAWLQAWERRGYPPLAVVVVGKRCWCGPADALPKLQGEGDPPVADDDLGHKAPSSIEPDAGGLV